MEKNPGGNALEEPPTISKGTDGLPTMKLEQNKAWQETETETERDRLKFRPGEI